MEWEKAKVYGDMTFVIWYNKIGSFLSLFLGLSIRVGYVDIELGLTNSEWTQTFVSVSLMCHRMCFSSGLGEGCWVPWVFTDTHSSYELL